MLTIAKTKKFFILCGLATLALLNSSITYASAPDKSLVKGYLEGYEWQIVPEHFEQLGEDVDLTLMAIVTDPEPMLNYYRFRALEVLRLYTKPRVADFLENYVNEQQSVPLLSRAFNSFSRGFVQTEPERVQKLASKLLQHENARLRIEAANSLKSINTPEAQQLLKNQINQEKETWVRQRMQ